MDEYDEKKFQDEEDRDNGQAKPNQDEVDSFLQQRKMTAAPQAFLKPTHRPPPPPLRPTHTSTPRVRQ